MAYADYMYYLESYHGVMPAADFSRHCERASDYLDRITIGRAELNRENDALKRACCAVADAMLLCEKGGGVISSESNDGVTVTYATSVSNMPSDNQRLYEAAASCLAWTGLLFRGVF